MNDRYAEALEQYELDVLSVRKGRGAWLCDTSLGLKLLKEYRGTVRRLDFEDQVLGALDTRTSLRADRYIRNREGELLTTLGDGSRYILKDWYGDRECSLRDGYEIRQAISRLAMLHCQLRKVEFKEEWAMGSTCEQPLEAEMDRHNREMQRTRNYIRSQHRRSDFELCVAESFGMFRAEALEAAKGMRNLWIQENTSDRTLLQIPASAKLLTSARSVPLGHEAEPYLEAAELAGGKRTAKQSEATAGKSVEAMVGRSAEKPSRPLYLCHGDLDQHHLLMGADYTAIIEYNRMHLGIQASDLYRFMRKVMEKHGWNQDLGLSMLDSYERVLPMEKKERACLYYLFLYPEKYWKQLNFYNNANKAWIPARNTDKLKSLEFQQPARRRFLERLEKECGV